MPASCEWLCRLHDRLVSGRVCSSQAREERGNELGHKNKTLLIILWQTLVARPICVAH